VRGPLTSALAVREYVLGGRGAITVRSLATGAHRTFEMRAPGRDLPPTAIEVWRLRGPDNGHDYVFAGVLLPIKGGYRFQSLDSEASWIFARIARGLPPTAAMMAQCEVWHEGVCGRCRRRLTRPDSIERGLGPECAARLEDGGT